MVEAVYANLDSAPVSQHVKAALRLIEIFTLRPEQFGPADILATRADGLSDEAVTDALHVSTLFNVIDRLADSFDWALPGRGGFKPAARAILKVGYRFFPPPLWPKP